MIRSRNVELTDELRSRVSERAARLMAANPHIHEIAITLEGTPVPATQPVVAKGEVMFDGPALLTSVTATEPVQALEYLMEKIEHQMRRQRAPRQALLSRRPPPLRGSASAPVVPVSRRAAGENAS